MERTMSYKIEFFSPVPQAWVEIDSDSPPSYTGGLTLRETAESYMRELSRGRRPRAFSAEQIHESRDFFLDFWLRKKLNDSFPLCEARCRFLNLEGRTIRVIHSKIPVCDIPEDPEVRFLVTVLAKGGLSEALDEQNGTDECAFFLALLTAISIVAIASVIFSSIRSS